MDELEKLIRACRETLSVEYKRSMNWAEAVTKGKVIRAALAMANKRDGGILVFGVEASPGGVGYELVGMDEDNYHSFNTDEVLSVVNAHVSPSVDLSVEHKVIDEKYFVAVVVREFSDYPVVCTRDFVIDAKAVVIRGRLYCRGRRMPESAEVQSPEDIREIIELATAKGLERYVKFRQIEQRLQGPSDRVRFGDQVRGLEE